jgi:hypothetical protein
MKKDAKWLLRKSYSQRFNDQHRAHKQARVARNTYSQVMRKTKERRWLESPGEGTIWGASRLVMGAGSDEGRARIPTLRKRDPRSKEVVETATLNEEKGAMLFKLFFLLKPQESSVPNNPHYPKPRWQFENISNDQIQRTIRKMRPYKATQRDTPSNVIFKYAGDLLIDYIGPIFRATFSTGSYPEGWATTETLVLKKPGKTDYMEPSAWRPIVLSNGMTRLLNTCVAEDIINKCESLGILLDRRFGGRLGRSTTDAIHLLVKEVKDAWRKGKVMSILFLDVKSAYPSVAVDWLIHNMHKRGIPEEYTNWMRRRMAPRRTTLTFDDYKSEQFGINNGLDQGDPFSLICYLIYNADTLDILDNKKGEKGYMFVDDTTIAATGNDFEEARAKLKDIMTRQGGILDWAKAHNCEFGIAKFQLLDLTRQHQEHQP